MLQITNLTINHTGTDLLKDFSVNIEGKAKKRIAIVGKNGSGKSSLLKSIVGIYETIPGEVNIYQEIVSYLPQEPNFGEHQLVGEYLESLMAEAWHNYKVDIAMQAVGLAPEYLIAEIHHLSGGEKIKVALAGLLLSEPTILLLDEPTNNLDQKGIDWLEDFIRNFKGTILIVSHDRSLICHVIPEIWEMDSQYQTIQKYTGNYENFLIQRAHYRNRLLHQYEKEEAEIEELRLWVRANSNQQKLRFSSLLASKKAALERAQEQHISKPIIDPVMKPARIPATTIGLALKVDIQGKQFADKQLLAGVKFKVHGTEKVLIQGKNGAGKTTLLNILAGLDTDYQGLVEYGDKLVIGYLRQHSELAKNKTVLDAFSDATRKPESIARSILHRFLFPTDFIDNKIVTLSYGEQRRLELAIMLCQEPSLLILDEPTNHLDIFSREVLEKLIIEQPIPMIIVSHDRYFIEKLRIEKIITIE
ncbi:MAG: ABC-F family ATP-binding cassette domain-containing protein [Candidatus Abawacabacteria bacterium]|nr:ABC-F family ATP-binding cassette domain-containing protein [Candidatus Abawacabacteria bacterium]